MLMLALAPNGERHSDMNITAMLWRHRVDGATDGSFSASHIRFAFKVVRLRALLCATSINNTTSHHGFEIHNHFE